MHAVAALVGPMLSATVETLWKRDVMDQIQRNASASEGDSPVGGFAALVPELDVTDLTVSLKFWCEILGFEIAYARPAANFVYIQREAIQVMLCQINGEWITGRLEPPFGRGINFQMAVGNLDTVISSLEKHSWPLFRSVQEKTYQVGNKCLISREFLVQDPDGYLLRFAQHC